MDLERQRRRLLGLDQRDLGERLAAPFDAVDVERLPGPVGAGLRIEEERPLERRLDGLRSRRRLEAQRRRVGGAVVLQPPVLGVLERLQAAEDLLDRDLALGGDGDLLLDPLALGGRRAVEPQHGHPSGRAHLQHERAAGHLAAGRRHPLAADREPHRPAELRLVEAERQILGSRRSEGDHPQPEILAAHEGPGLFSAGGGGAGIPGEVAGEFAGEEDQRREHGDEPRRLQSGGLEQRQVDAERGVAGGVGQHLGGIGRDGPGVEHHRPPGIEVLHRVDRRLERLRRGRLESHRLQIGRDLLGVERLEDLGIGGERLGGHLRLLLSPGERHGGPLQEEGVLSGGKAPRLRPPDDLEPGPGRSLRRDRGGGAQLRLQALGALSERRRSREDERQPGRRAAAADRGREAGVGRGIPR